MMTSSPPPPSLRLSVLSQTARFFRDPFGLIRQARQEHGEVFALHLLGIGRWVVICSPEVLADLHRRGLDEVVAGEARGPMMGFLVGDRVSLGFDGEPHQRRRMATAPLLGAHRLRAHEPAIQQLAEQTLDRCPLGQSFAFQPRCDDFTLRVIHHMLFHCSPPAIAEPMVELARRFLLTMRSPVVLSGKLRWSLGRLTPWGRFVATRQRLYRAVRAELTRREEAGGEPQHADLAEALRCTDLEDDPELQRQAVEQEIAGFYIGGSETTAKTIAWTLLGVLETPGCLDRLRAEIEGTLASAPLTAADLDRLPYLVAVIKEGLRFQKITPVVGPRLAKRDLVLGGYAIPAGTVLLQAHAESGRNPHFPHPERFDPDNFLGRDVPFAHYLPFGGGNRMCTGMALTQLEIAILLATLVRRFDITKTAGSLDPQPAGIAFQPRGFTLRLDERRGPR